MDKKLNVGQHSLMGYLPALVVKNILDGVLKKSSDLPIYYTMNSVCFMADISGFTKLSETYSVVGRMGAEILAFMLNRYMEQISNFLYFKNQVTMIGKNGGDIFKFAGDALLVIWPETGGKEKEDSQYLCRRAIQCALEIQNKLKNNIAKLSVKIGIGIGEFKIVFVGGQFDRCEYLIIGEGMKQACESETHAEGGGEVICSNDVFTLVKDFYDFENCKSSSHGGSSTTDEKEEIYHKIIKDHEIRVPTKADAFIMRTKFNHEKLRENNSNLKRFVPAAITLHLDIEQEFWSKELRMITVMFLNLGIDLSHTETEEGMLRVQVIVKTIQRCIYRTRGSLNKFLMDDKGSLMLICWGLPPMSATDDHLRGVLTAFDLIKELKDLDCEGYMGISTGTAFSGVCGTMGNRKEYSLLGEIVNLGARNMQKAREISMKKKPVDKYCVLICDRTAEVFLSFF